MVDNSINNKRIAKNTILLYFRMLFMMAVSLYTSRVVLNTLGVEDYGIYNVVGGVVAMFGFLNSAMTTSTQRYITYELGRGNFERLKQVFSTSVNIHFLISIVVVILAETIGLWFLKEKMVIPSERFMAAMWVYQLSILTTIIAIMSYPYNAAIIAHEKMSAFAYITVLEAILKLAIVYFLTICNYDKLVLYAILIAVIQLSIRFCYTSYCSKHFPESNYYLYFDKPLFKEMLGFAGWNLLGNGVYMLNAQGVNMLLNVFFGPSVNAARAVAVQVQGAIHKFSANFQMALNPQITKTYAVGEMNQMHRLIFRSSKFTFILLFLFCLPVLIEAPIILKIWLKTVPDYSVPFLRIMIATMLIDSNANSLLISASATGKVKTYQSVVGGIMLAVIPISYIVLKLGGAPWTVFFVDMCICGIAYILRLYVIRPLINLQIRPFIKEVTFRCVIVAATAAIIPMSIWIIAPRTMFVSIIIILISILSSAFCSFYFGLDKHERSVIIAKVYKIKRKFLGKFF